MMIEIIQLEVAYYAGAAMLNLSGDADLTLSKTKERGRDFPSRQSDNMRVAAVSSASDQKACFDYAPRWEIVKHAAKFVRRRHVAGVARGCGKSR